LTPVNELVEDIKKVLPKRRPLHHHEPFTKKITLDAFPYDFINTLDVKKFEEDLGKITKVKHVLAVNSGTSALHVALLALGIQPGDEVLVPSLTFAGTANAITYCNAIPHFIDCNLSINPLKLEAYLDKLKNGWVYQEDKKPLPKAIIVVHLLGHPADIGTICQIAKKYGLAVIEDCAQALGTRINGRHVGTFGDVGCFSFNNNKIVTTNGGGAVITNDALLANMAHDLASTARKPHPWLIEHTQIGYNYRMGNINAALGLSQLDRLNEILEYKKQLHDKYKIHLGHIVKFIEPSFGMSNHWLNTIIVDEFDHIENIEDIPTGEVPPTPNPSDIRDQVLTKLHDDGIYARALNTPLTDLGIYPKSRNSGIQWAARDTFKRAISLPSGDNLL
jgi:perosamine synthetase